LNRLIAVDGQRRWADGCVEKERRYFISSLQDTDAQTFGRLSRSHWQVENSPLCATRLGQGFAVRGAWE
jgi:hypothetical protein